VSLAEAIMDCSVPLTGIRFTPASIVDGRITQKPEEFRFKFTGSVQSLTGRELQRLLEGQRNSGRQKLYTDKDLFTVQTSECKLADRVLYKNATYQVDRVSDWEDIGGYFRVELERMTR